jgi:hypothetical protein
MQFFSEFPKEKFNYKGGYSLQLIDIGVRIKLLDYIQDNNLSAVGIRNNYEIVNYKRPDQVSYELYQKHDYTWTLLVLNNIHNVYEEWIQPVDLVEQKLIQKYGSVEKSNKIPVAFYSEFGYEISESSVAKVRQDFGNREENYVLLEQTKIQIEEYRKKDLQEDDVWIEKLEQEKLKKVKSLNEIGRVIKNRGPQHETAYERAMRENEEKRFIRIFEPNIMFRIQADLYTIFET